MACWLFKTEPESWSWTDQVAKGAAGQEWDGVRNFQARAHMRAMKKGDRGFFYHSSCDEPGIAGIVEICAAAQPDETQFDRKSPYYDRAATREEPRWYNVDVRLVGKTRLVSLNELRADKALRGLQILRRGNRLSITPVTPAEWRRIMALVKRKT